MSSKAGFTLLEIIMVVLIIGIGTAAVVPIALDSLEGARLREATRTLISMNKYARAKAVLLRKPVGVLYDLERSTMELILLPPQQQALGPFLDQPRLRMNANEDDWDEEEFSDREGGIETLQQKVLAEYVVVEEVEGGEEVDETVYAIYYPSGMCDSHTVVLRDNRGDTQTIRIEGLTGDVILEESR